MQMVALEEARKEAQAAAQAFDAIRQARHDSFSMAFAHIAASINNIYQELTRSTVHKLGRCLIIAQKVLSRCSVGASLLLRRCSVGASF